MLVLICLKGQILDFFFSFFFKITFLNTVTLEQVEVYALMSAIVPLRMYYYYYYH